MDNQDENLLNQIESNPLQNQEEEEDQEEIRRRDEELGNLIQNVLDDFDFDETTASQISSVAHSVEMNSEQDHKACVAEIESLKQQVESLKKELEQEKKICSNKTDLAEQELQGSKLAVCHLRELLVEKKLYIKTLNTQIEALKDENDAKLVEIKELKEENEGLKSVIQALSRKYVDEQAAAAASSSDKLSDRVMLESCREENALLRKQLLSLEQSISKLEKVHNEKLNTLREALDDAEIRLCRHREETHRLATQLERTESQRKELRERITLHNDEKNVATREINRLTDKIQSLEFELGNREREISNRELAISDRDELLRDFLRSANASQNVETVETSVEESATSSELTSESGATTPEDPVQILHDKICKFQDNIDLLASQVQEKEEDNQLLLQRAIEAESKVEVANEMIKSQLDENLGLKEEVTKCQKDVQEIGSVMDVLMKRGFNVTAAVESANRCFEVLLTGLEELEAQTQYTPDINHALTQTDQPTTVDVTCCTDPCEVLEVGKFKQETEYLKDELQKYKDMYDNAKDDVIKYLKMFVQQIKVLEMNIEKVEAKQTADAKAAKMFQSQLTHLQQIFDEYHVLSQARIRSLEMTQKRLLTNTTRVIHKIKSVSYQADRKLDAIFTSSGSSSD